MYINQTGRQFVNFKAKLYDMDGDRIKAFTLSDSINGIDEMANRGNKNTSIRVNNIISKERNGSYKNYADVTLSNPLFDTVSFLYPLRHETNAPVKEDSADVIWHLDLLTGMRSNDCKHLEDIALKKSLLKEIVSAVKNKDEINPVKILQKRLADLKSNGDFSTERITDFEKIADSLLNFLIEEGVKNLDING